MQIAIKRRGRKEEGGKIEEGKKRRKGGKMSRRQKAPLRELSEAERTELERMSQARSQRAGEVVRAKVLLAADGGQTYTQAAQSVGRKSNDAVAQLVERFNQEGIEAIVARHGGGFKVQYGTSERNRILAEVQREPDREADGTATWSLSTLQHALRRSPDGLPQVSTYTIRQVLQAHGYRWQRSRSWCQTGVVERRRKSGMVIVCDDDSEAKKN